MNNRKQTELGKVLHQLCNYTAFYNFYLKAWLGYSNHKVVNQILKQQHSNMETTIDRIAKAIGNPELAIFVRRQLSDENRLADLMAILEICSKMNTTSIANIRTSLENQLQPILDAEFNENQTTIDYAE